MSISCGLRSEIRQLEREELKIKNEIKKLAAKGQKTAVETLAKALVKSRQVGDRSMRVCDCLVDLPPHDADEGQAGSVQGAHQLDYARPEDAR